MEEIRDDLLFYGTDGPRDAEVAIVGESWGAEEERKRKPLVGTSGFLSDTILHESGWSRSRTFITNVCSRRPAGNDMRLFFHPTSEAKALGLQPLHGLFPREETQRDLVRLHQQLLRVRPKVILAYGNYALWALCYGICRIKNEDGWKVPTGITFWRGSLCTWDVGLNGHTPRIPVIPLIHPAAIQRKWEQKQFTIQDIRKRVLPIVAGRIEEPHYDFKLRPTFQEVLDWINQELRGSRRRWAVDIETRAGHIACIGLATSDRRAISIPLMCTERPEGYFTADQELLLHRVLQQVLTSKTIEIVGQNYSYDMQYLGKFLLISPKVDLDTMTMQHLAWPGVPASLWFIASMYNRYYRYWKDEGKLWDEALPEDQLWRYNCIDAVNTWEASYHLEAVLKKLKLYHLLEEQMEVLRLQVEMMNFGVRVDEKARASMTWEVLEEIYELEKFFTQIMPADLRPQLYGKTGRGSDWWSSPSQLCKFFYDALGVRPVLNDDGEPKMDDDALQHIKAYNPLLRPICERIQDYRTLSIFEKNFLSAELDPDGRMRTGYTQLPKTFRWSSKENAFGRGTNLQTIPRGQEE